jgi:hypothetical protein
MNKVPKVAATTKKKQFEITHEKGGGHRENRKRRTCHELTTLFSRDGARGRAEIRSG